MFPMQVQCVCVFMSMCVRLYVCVWLDGWAGVRLGGYEAGSFVGAAVYAFPLSY